ncbi:MAG: CAP domain-containing protein [Chloroflexaceae bacterium]|nr:CAP domain-containing protein [Chloroflexaceae bacterium]
MAGTGHSEPDTPRRGRSGRSSAGTDQRAPHRAGCPPLTRNNQLDTAAYAHSEDMALNDYFAHESRDGSPFWMRIQAAGYNFALAAENLVAGTADPAVAVATWMSSDAHRVNILNCDLTETGLGFYTLDGDTGNINYTYYWTQVFATPQ